MSRKKPVLLAILDGTALRDEEKGNAFKQANTPVFDKLWANFPHTKLKAAGEAVGLPEGQMGNSEVGHLNIGAGRTVYQSLTLINKSIKDGDFFLNKELQKAALNAKENNGAFHIFGLISNGGVHSSNEHVYALLEFAKKEGLDKVYVHAMLDGRDVAPNSGLKFINDLESKIEEIGIGQIASISGRYYSMDRDKRWDRVEKAYDAIVLRKGLSFDNLNDYIQASYDENTYDEFVLPAFNNAVDGAVKDNDSVVFSNFRPDRATQLAAVITNPDYKSFDVQNRPSVYFVSMMKYSNDVKAHIAFEPQQLKNTLGAYVYKQGLKQLRIAETEKFPHVTFFFNGGEENPYPGEERILVASPKVATYDLQPEMSAPEVTEKLIAAIKEEKFDLIILNYANNDMVGHSGMLEPTIKSVETIDALLGQVLDTVEEVGGVSVVTADHGNADEEVTLEGQPMTAHTTNPVPFIITQSGFELREGGKLGDIAPTVLELLELDKPVEMDGESLIIK